MKNNDIKVSVLCTAYNHENFLEKCITSIVSQKTNFKFELIINDDVSTDNTKHIIEKYAKLYPEIIVPLYQKENQFSKGISLLDDILFPVSRGKYIAVCEGDDYWCDNNKLQLQYDFMEENIDCVACYHNSYYHHINDTSFNRKFNNWKEIHYLTPKEIINGCYAHTSSFFVRREKFQTPKWARDYWFGDYVKKTIDLSNGKVVALPQIMSVYNAGNPQGAMEILHKDTDIQKKYNKLMTQVEYLEKYNEYTNYQFQNYIQAEIFACEKSALKILHYDNLKLFKQKLKQHKYLKQYLKNVGLISKIKLYIILYSPTWIFNILTKVRNRNGRS